MSDYKVTDSELTGIANAIRTKGGTSSPLVFPNGFTSAIEAIPTGGGSTLITKNISANGTYDAEDDDADGYSSVVVNVPSGSGIPLMTRVDWDALTLFQKQQYGFVGVKDNPNAYEAGVLYNGNFTPIIPKMTSDTTPYGRASSNSTFISYTAAFCAFNRTPTDSSMKNGWLPAANVSPVWLMYEFDNYKVELVGIDITTANNADAAQRDVYIEGRVNNEWVNLLYTEKEELTFYYHSYGENAHKFNFELRSTTIDAIRLRFVEPLYGSGSACTIDEVQVYGRAVPNS